MTKLAMILTFMALVFVTQVGHTQAANTYSPPVPGAWVDQNGGAYGSGQNMLNGQGCPVSVASVIDSDPKVRRVKKAVDAADKEADKAVRDLEKADKALARAKEKLDRDHLLINDYNSDRIIRELSACRSFASDGATKAENNPDFWKFEIDSKDVKGWKNSLSGWEGLKSDSGKSHCARAVTKKSPPNPDGEDLYNVCEAHNFPVPKVAKIDTTKDEMFPGAVPNTKDEAECRLRLTAYEVAAKAQKEAEDRLKALNDKAEDLEKDLEDVREDAKDHPRIRNTECAGCDAEDRIASHRGIDWTRAAVGGGMAIFNSLLFAHEQSQFAKQDAQLGYPYSLRPMSAGLSYGMPWAQYGLYGQMGGGLAGGGFGCSSTLYGGYNGGGPWPGGQYGGGGFPYGGGMYNPGYGQGGFNGPWGVGGGAGGGNGFPQPPWAQGGAGGYSPYGPLYGGGIGVGGGIGGPNPWGPPGNYNNGLPGNFGGQFGGNYMGGGGVNPMMPGYGYGQNGYNPFAAMTNGYNPNAINSAYNGNTALADANRLAAIANSEFQQSYQSYGLGVDYWQTSQAIRAGGGYGGYGGSGGSPYGGYPGYNQGYITGYNPNAPGVNVGFGLNYSSGAGYFGGGTGVTNIALPGGGQPPPPGPR